MKVMKKVKGFTLIELIVVMAIFGVVLFAAMSLMTPTGKILNTTYSMEQKASTLLNAKDYLEQTFHYAEYIQVMGSEPTQADLERFVHEHYAGKLHQNASGDMVYSSGEIHVMCLDNSTVAADGSSHPGGQISTWTYNYTAGDKKADDDATNDIPSSVDMTNVKHEEWVINRANYTDNWYRFSLGVYHLSDTVASGSLTPDTDVMKPQLEGGLGGFGQNNFSISVLSYPAITARNTEKGITPDFSVTPVRYPSGSISVASTNLPNIVDNRQHTAWNWQDDTDPTTGATTRAIKEDPAKNGSKLTIAGNHDHAFEIDPSLLDANGCHTFDGQIYIIYSYIDDDLV